MELDSQDLTDRQKKAIERCYHWKKGTLTSFTAGLFDLFCKADFSNTAKLASVFREEYQAWQCWQLSEDEEEFFHQVEELFGWEKT